MACRPLDAPPAPLIAPRCLARPLQGGMPGAERLRDCQPLTDLVAKQKAADKLHAAICATARRGV